MKDRRKSFTAEFKTKVALEAIKGHQTVSEIASDHGVYPHQITQWKKHAIEGLRGNTDRRGIKVALWAWVRTVTHNPEIPSGSLIRP